jgi:hypothetical protein
MGMLLPVFLGAGCTKRSSVEEPSDADLRSAIRSAMRQHFFREGERTLDDCLREALQRGGKEWEDFIAEEARAGGESPQLVLLTALRRLQGRPDPVEVVVEGDREVVLTWPVEHTLRVALRLAEGEPGPIAFMEGGDYRSGRQERFRIAARDSSGNVLPPRGRLSMTGGGLIDHGELTPGRAWKTELDLTSYVHLSKPGTYRVRVEYHDRQCISDLADVSRLILCRSPEITITAEPRTVPLSAQERKDIAGWIEAIDAGEPLKVLEGPYTEESHDFIAPGSPAGMILAAGWKSFPGLVEAAGKEDLEPRKRAWLFSLLFTVTGLNDPREVNALGPHTYRERGWAVGGGFDKPELRGFGGFGEGSAIGGSVDLEAQRQLARRWRETLDLVRVEAR